MDGWGQRLGRFPGRVDVITWPPARNTTKKASSKPTSDSLREVYNPKLSES